MVWDCTEDNCIDSVINIKKFNSLRINVASVQYSICNFLKEILIIEFYFWTFSYERKLQGFISQFFGLYFLFHLDPIIFLKFEEFGVLLVL